MALRRRELDALARAIDDHFARRPPRKRLTAGTRALIALVERTLDQISASGAVVTSSASRENLFDYLSNVYAAVYLFKRREQLAFFAEQTLFRFPGVNFRKSNSLFAIIFKVTINTNKQNKSKWSCVLQHAWDHRVSPSSLSEWVKDCGGVNACAASYRPDALPLTLQRIRTLEHYGNGDDYEPGYDDEEELREGDGWRDELGLDDDDDDGKMEAGSEDEDLEDDITW